MAALVRQLFIIRRREERQRHRDALRAMRDALHRELDRSRRYNRRMVLMRADLAGDESQEKLVESVGKVLRSTDVFCVAERHLYLLLPEVGSSAAQRAFERIRDLAPRSLRGDTVAIAAFPDDGLTMGALLAILRDGTLDRGRGLGHTSQPPDPSSATPAS